MSIKRPVAGVKADGQLSLLDGPCRDKPPDEPAGGFAEAVRFKDPDPERIWFGDQSLRCYLESVGMGFAFVLRDLFRDIDLSMFEAQYKPGGRSPYAPALMVSLIVYGLVQGVSSLRGLESLCRRDLVCHWLAGGACPDHATIGRFINKHAEAISGPLFESVTAAVLEQLPETNCELAVDGTIVEACASRYARVKAEAAEQWVERVNEKLEALPDDAARQKEVELAECCAAELAERAEARRRARKGDPSDVRVSTTDPQSVYLKLKDKRFGFAYVPSIAVNRQRLILAQKVHPSAEISQVEGLLDQSERLIGTCERLCLDANYFGFEVLKLADERQLDVLCPAPEQARRAKKKAPKKFPKQRFIYIDEMGTYRCPAGELMVPGGRGFNKRQAQHYQSFYTPACNQGCLFRDRCTDSKRGRRIKRWQFDHLQETMRQVMEQPAAQRAYGHRRGSVEPVFGELRHIQGLGRFRRRGLRGVQVEFALHAMAHNLRRLKVALKKRWAVNSRQLWDLIWDLMVQIRLFTLRHLITAPRSGSLKNAAAQGPANSTVPLFVAGPF